MTAAKRCAAAALATTIMLAAPAAATEPGAAFFTPVLGETRGPIGWFEFCDRLPRECTYRAPMRDVAVTLEPAAWRALVRVNDLVNGRVKPMSDLDHYGVAERWAYPDDDFGDCEDVALAKRRMLIAAGWPLAALLMTIVSTDNGEAHAVLTVRTDQGDFVLDNRATDVKLWSGTGYRFRMRQSQANPNIWVALGDHTAGTASVP